MLSRLLDIIFPRRCLMCDSALAHGEEVLCVECLMQAPVIHSHDFVSGEMCRIFWHLLPIERAAAMFRYTSDSQWRLLVTAGKFGGRHDTLTGLGRLMAQHFSRKGFFNGIDAIVPMPSTPQHERRRGYNQAELLARGVAQITGLPVLANVVTNHGDNISQTHRYRMERRMAQHGRFTLMRQEPVQGKHLLLIDDVCTTGASLAALGNALLSVPGVRLSILTLMRTSIG